MTRSEAEARPKQEHMVLVAMGTVMRICTCIFCFGPHRFVIILPVNTYINTDIESFI